MKITYKGKSIHLETKKVSEIGKVTGLMLHSKKTKNLLFEFQNPTRLRIHSLFVLFKFLAIWTDEKNRVVDFKIVYPFTLAVKSKTPFTKLIEVPINRENRKIIRFFVGEGKV